MPKKAKLWPRIGLGEDARKRGQGRHQRIEVLVFDGHAAGQHLFRLHIDLEMLTGVRQATQSRVFSADYF
jgi:hypothetical protein